MIAAPPTLRRLGALAPLLLAAVSTTCSDDATGPGGARAASLALAPVLPPGASLAAFGIAIDSVRALVIRPASDTILRRTVPFPADSSGIELSLSVNLRDTVETLVVTLEFRGGGMPLFAGTQSVTVRPGPSDGTVPTTIPLTYVGPGAGVDSLVVTPVDSVVTWNDSLRFRVEAYQTGSPVAQFYVSWTSDDPAAPVNAFGVFRAPARRDTIVVTARTRRRRKPRPVSALRSARPASPHRARSRSWAAICRAARPVCRWGSRCACA